MNPLRLFTTLFLFAVVALLATLHGPYPACLVLFAGGAILSPWQLTPQLNAVTLTPTILLQQTMRALFVKCPALLFFASEFTSERLKLNQQVIGKIRLRPTTGLYDANNGGYKAGSQESRDLLLDVPFVMDQHIHITIKVSHLNALQDSIQKMEEHIQDSASVLGKAVGRYILGKVSSAAFSNSTLYTTANSNKDMLNAVRKAMNLRGVGDGRFGLVNSDVFETLSNDARITNRYDDRSKDTDGNALGWLQNIAGFRNIVEDPELGTGTASSTIAVTGESDTEVFTSTGPHGLVVNQRVQLADVTGGTGIAAGYFFVKSTPTATTFTLSATRGGTMSAYSTDITAATIKSAENITGIFATREAIAIKTGLPTDSLEAARALGIPTPVSDEVVTDPDTGLSMIMYKWFEPGTMDAYVTLAVLYGATAGALADSTAKVMEPSAQILRSA